MSRNVFSKNVSFIRNVGTSVKANKTWLFFESLVLEAANLKPGDRIEMTVVMDKRALVFKKSDIGDHVVSRRKRAGQTKERPLMDRCNEQISVVIRQRKRIDILVADGILIVREEQSFDFCVFDRPALQGSDLKKFRLMSLPSGAGLATKALESTGFFEPVFGGDILSEAVETYKFNFPDGASYWGDLRKLHPDYLEPVDAVWLSPSCTKYSLLVGQGSAGGFLEGMGPFYANLVLASQAKIVLIEEIIPYFGSRSYEHLKMLLQHSFPYITQMNLNAFDFGSPAGRNRGYVVMSQSPLENFKWPEPKIPDHRRPTIEQTIGKDWENRAPFRETRGTVMEGLLNKSGNNNFKADKNYTLVKPNDTRMAALVASYSKIQVTSSYLLHPDHPNLWRPFTSWEASRILDIPDDFGFPESISETKRMYMIGNGVDCRVAKAIGIEAAYHLMMSRLGANSNRPAPVQTESWMKVDPNGQFSFVLGA
ncbi:DNA cytosine methyltransferase [Paenibacillus sp. WQ 127069]|uniref:DNA (cytosine-5-)-methyltransferase n=1 Tax=Paenibacillus baimaensis TaxID=2982185 RepID=A0ABT2UFB3_9BACL|nr:DNA cytosine methyltransferase [Paenibacillus sp. WQ 127069]MCU6793328.1 DNA cytosine methyltransferase [Paenibacillus sp. WQ 127069]